MNFTKKDIREIIERLANQKNMVEVVNEANVISKELGIKISLDEDEDDIILEDTDDWDDDDFDDDDGNDEELDGYY